jgi:trehalose 6-phosphate synthase
MARRAAQQTGQAEAAAWGGAPRARSPRVVVVSNRLPSLSRGWTGDGPPEIAAGGLASALFSALCAKREALWFGWNGEVAERNDGWLRREIDRLTLVGMPLPRADLERYYRGFCNRALWPLLHCFQDRIVLSPADELAYQRVQSRFARALWPLLHDDDLVWVHDYHLISLGRELRVHGWRGRLGFFLHTPFPPHELWSLLPRPGQLLADLLEYDLVGFHVPRYVENYAICCQRELGARWSRGAMRVGGREQAVDAYPIGIDPAPFLPRGRLSSPGLGALVSGRARVLLGVDRLDYTKGIAERVLAFEQLLRRYPHWKGRLTLVQIASPSRLGVASYSQQKRRIDSLVGRINGEWAEPDWQPIRYLYRSYSREQLAGLYRGAHVGLVTPLRDGMNLVAKEFIAAQDPADPGVLVLSRLAGAADALSEAVLVNPCVPSDVAAGVVRALEMTLEERQKRHAALLPRVLDDTAETWARRFLDDLQNADELLRADPLCAGQEPRTTQGVSSPLLEAAASESAPLPEPSRRPARRVPGVSGLAPPSDSAGEAS